MLKLFHRLVGRGGRQISKPTMTSAVGQCQERGCHLSTTEGYQILDGISWCFPGGGSGGPWPGKGRQTERTACVKAEVGEAWGFGGQSGSQNTGGLIEVKPE